MRHIQHSHRDDRRDQEYHVEPAVVKVKVDVSEHLGNDDPVLRGKVHPHQQDTRHEVHPHDLGQEEDEEVTRFSTGDGVEPFDEVD